MANPTFKPSEGKREEFRKYLDKNGVMDGLTKVLVNLYEEPEKPEDALEYIRDRLAIQAGLETFSQLKAKIDDLQGKIESLTQELEEAKLAATAPPETEPTEPPADGGDDDAAAAAVIAPEEEVPPEQEPTPEEPPQEEQPPPADNQEP